MQTTDATVIQNHERLGATPQILASLKAKVGEGAFDSWLKGVSFGAVGATGVAGVFVPTGFMKSWVSKNYKKEILEAMEENGVAASDLRFCVRPASASATAGKPAPAEETAEARPSSLASLCDTAVAAPIGSALDPRFAFEGFVVGKPNEFAVAAAKRLASSPKSPFNPLFFYSGVGLGKTHLMQAIAWEIRRMAPERSVAYLSAEKFMGLFTEALRTRSTGSFKDMFRSVDVLLVDDVQFLIGKGATQEEFFHTFNALIESGSQLVMAADRAPMLLDGIGERLQNRMVGGLVANIDPPNYDLRLNIVRFKQARLGVELPPEVVEFLALRVTSNVRELEGALLRLIAHADLMTEEITVARAEVLLGDVLGGAARRLSLDDIQRKVAEHFKISSDDILSARRDRSVARPRQVAMYLSKHLTSRSLPEIGRRFKKDHTTVIHAVRTIEGLMARDAGLARDVEVLSRQLGGC
ncbi:chromosomal replication initiator protein DnaA [Alphaproteobacteria bacterium]|nr:chromosomal replication initiator protein DnaA [Alphaproteobacteria bacterium]